MTVPVLVAFLLINCYEMCFWSLAGVYINSMVSL